MSTAIEMHGQQIYERTTLLREVKGLPDDHLCQGEPAQGGPEQVADCLAPPSPTQGIESTSEAGQLLPDLD
jgi:hypothetical protein